MAICELRTPAIMAGGSSDRKIGVSNHTAFDIPDDPCLSKFGALRRMSPHATDNFKNFRVALIPLLNKNIIAEADVLGGICHIFNSRCQRVSARAILYCL